MIKKLLAKIKKFFKRQNSINFINTGEALPSPLSKQEEDFYIKKYMDGDKKAKDILIEHNLRLVVYIAKKFESSKVEMDDLISIGTAGLIKAVNSFKLDKNIKLATFASRCIENEILMHLRKVARKRKEVSLEEPINIDGEGNVLMLADIIGSDQDMLYKNMEQEIEKDLLKKSFETLEEKEKQIIKLRFGIFGSEKKTQKEIADYFGISQSYISRLEKKIMEKLKAEIEKLS